MSPATELSDRARLRIGTCLRGDKYTIERLLGMGGMGAVYSATHRNGMRVAVKVLHQELARVEELKRRFLREGYIANKVQHPGVVRILDDDIDDDGSTFLVMELLEGATLDAEWASAGMRLPFFRVGAIVDRLLDVLIAVHGEGIVHRDVKPENVFLTTKGELKLLDLGIARLVESRSTTASGQQMGTPEYVAPEQAAGNIQEIDSRADVYSVGAVMFSLTTGKHVHEARTGMEQMIFAASRQARSIFDVWPEAPPAFANVVDVALMFDKNKRWSSAAEMRMALRRSMELHGHPVPPAAQPLQVGVRPVVAQEPSLPSTGTVILGQMQIAETEGDSVIPLVTRRPK